jgi:selenide,water dikinase
VGSDLADDAAVIRLTSELALIQTVDFFTPILDDPYLFGQVAAANALSDVYAMGGRPLCALNIVGFPADKMDFEVLGRILRGGQDKVAEAGAILVGGHSIDDPVVKYGLAVSGLVHPDRVITNAGARAKDALVLTKPLGTGVIATAVKGDLADAGVVNRMVEVMTALNQPAGEAMIEAEIKGATDVTGFGLLGHALEMARASRVRLVIEAGRVPLIEGVIDLAAMGMIPAGTFRNRDFCRHVMGVAEGVDPLRLDLLADAQTSGGMLISVPADRLTTLLAGLERHGAMCAQVIGRVEAEPPGTLTIEP